MEHKVNKFYAAAILFTGERNRIQAEHFHESLLVSLEAASSPQGRGIRARILSLL